MITIQKLNTQYIYTFWGWEGEGEGGWDFIICSLKFRGSREHQVGREGYHFTSLVQTHIYRVAKSRVGPKKHMAMSAYPDSSSFMLSSILKKPPYNYLFVV